jgi:hypothetical protein
MIVCTATAGAQDFEYVVPAFAYHLAGVGDNLWSSEIYITNPSGQEAAVRVGEFLPGKITIPVPCGPPSGIPREVPPLSTIVWTAVDIARELGCATEAVGALTFVADREVAISSRMVNEITGPPVQEGFIPGFGLEYPAFAAEATSGAGDRLLLPALVWHPESCSNPGFETAVGVVNLEQQAITVQLSFSGDRGPSQVYIDGELLESPFNFTVHARGWRQIEFSPPDGDDQNCKPAEVVDLLLAPSGEAMAYATVVDRSTQDGRIVLSIDVTDSIGPAGR